MFLSAKKPTLLPVLAACLALATAAYGQEEGSQHSSKRPVTVADAVGMTKLGNPSYFSGASSSGLVAQFSPDGRKFVVVLRKGKLEENTNEYSILLWHTHEIFETPKPELLLSLSSSSNRPAIRDVRWQDDNETIVFLGEYPGELQQIYSLNIRSRLLERLTNSPTNIVSYTMAAHGGRILYATEQSERSVFGEKERREGLIVSTESIFDIINGARNVANATSYGHVQFFVRGDGGRPLALRQRLLSPVVFNPPAMSPDGRYALIFAIVDSIPETWKGYVDPNIQWWTQHQQRSQPAGQRVFLLQIVLLDTLNGESRPLLDAPISTSIDAEVAWSSDSHSVVITNTFLPLGGIDAAEEKARRSTPFGLVEVKVPSGEVTKISQEGVKLLRWELQSGLLFCEETQNSRNRGPGPKLTFRKKGEKWERAAVPTLEESRPEIVLDEDMNTPPRIFAVNPGTHQKALLLDLNPKFKDLSFTKVEEIHWKSSNGHDARGGLYYPVSYVPGTRYPLVIQTHGWRTDRFDDLFTTAFAAEPLANRSMVVLQADDWATDEDWFADTNTPKELETGVSTYEGAIDDLDRRGLIDRNRVGIIGFSRTCLLVKYALVHSKYHFAAASVTDGVDGGYFQYVLSLKGRNPVDSEGLNGGVPFGEGLKSWMERSPGFNVDRVQTPLRITALSPNSALYEWEWFSTLTRLGKPVEMVVLHDGVHLLEKPWDRMASQQGNVDWFCFWLKGEEDPDPGKRSQYSRWRELRKLQRHNENGTGGTPSLPH